MENSAHLNMDIVFLGWKINDLLHIASVYCITYRTTGKLLTGGVKWRKARNGREPELMERGERRSYILMA